MTDPNGACERARNLFSSAHDDEFAAGEREFFFGHLRHCPACEREFSDYRKALGALRALQPVSAPRGFENRVLGAITEGAGRSTLVAMTVEPTPTQPMATRPGRFVPLRWAVAASVLAGAAAAIVTALAVRAPGPGPTPDVPPGMVRTGDRILPVTRFIEETLAAQGYARLGGRWVSRNEANAMARGETYFRGRWRTQWELREALLSEAEEPAVATAAGAPPAAAPGTPAPGTATPGAPAPGPAAPGSAPAQAAPAEDALRSLGYVKAGDRWVPAEEKACLDKGFVWYRDRWIPPAEFKKEVLVAEGFVFHEDRWMTREERERILASGPLVSRPGTPQERLAASLKNVSIGEPLLEEGFAVYPLYTRTTVPDEPWIPLDTALRGGKVEIRDEKLTRRLKVRNADDRPVFLLAGELLAGGHQDRVVARDAVVPPNRKWVDVEVYCAEPGRSAGRGERFDAVAAVAPLDLLRLLAADAGQPAVWSGIRRHLDAAAVKTPTDTLCALYAQGPVPERIKALERRLGDLPTRDVRTVGVAFGTDDGLAVAECFATNTLLRQAWPKLMAAAATQGGRRGAPARPKPDEAAPAVPNTRAGVNLLLESAIGGEWVPPAAGAETGMPYQLRSGESLFGEASLPEGRMGHVALYGDARGPAPGGAAAPPPAPYQLEPGKAQRLAAELARVMAAPDDAERVRAVREFGALRWDRAAETLATYIPTETDDAVRIALAEALAATRSPAAVKPLVDLIEKAPKRSPVLRAAALALARTGEPRAVDPLVKLLHQAEPETARVGLDASVLLATTLRDGASVEKTVSRLVAYFESLDAHTREVGSAAAVCMTHPLYEALYAPLRASMSGLARVPLASGAEARAWWNRNREAYLKTVPR